MDSQGAVDGGDPLGETAQSGGAVECRPATSVVDDDDLQAVVRASDGDLGVRRPRVLRDVGEAR